MTQRSSFFDSVSGDRTYSSDTIARAIASLMQADAVVAGYGSELNVQQQTPAAMGVNVQTGRLFAQGYYFEVYSTTENLSLSASNPTNPRIDVIVARRDLSARTFVLAVLTGTPASSPAAPALTQNVSGIWEFALAQVAVAANATSISNANITDRRGTRMAAAVGSLFDTAIGHHHDGTDSRKAVYTDLLSIPATFTPAVHTHADGSHGGQIAYSALTGIPSTFTPSAHASTHAPGSTDPLSTAIAGSSAVGDAAAVGTAATLSRSDHVHGREAFAAPATSAVGDANAAGVATTVARSDHKHGRESFATPAVVLGTAAAAGAATTPIRSDATIVAFDATVPSTQAIGDAAAVGAATVAARRDHKHAMPAFGTVTDGTSFGVAKADGSSATVSHSDHAHGSPAAPTPTSLNVPSTYNTPATATTRRIYVGTSTPTGASEGDVWIDG